jgi:hypothetical protein
METSPPTPQKTPQKVTYPRWLWALGAGLAVVIVACVVLLAAQSSTNSTNLAGGAVERLIPADDDKMLQQAPVGIDLAAGYDGTLTVNGVPIPEDQLTRTPQLNLVEFQPGPGKEIEQLPPGENCVVATFWRSETGPAQSSGVSWCFTVV